MGALLRCKLQLSRCGPVSVYASQPPRKATAMQQRECRRNNFRIVFNACILRVERLFAYFEPHSVDVAFGSFCAFRRMQLRAAAKHDDDDDGSVCAQSLRFQVRSRPPPTTTKRDLHSFGSPRESAYVKRFVAVMLRLFPFQVRYTKSFATFRSACRSRNEVAISNGAK